MAERWTEIGLGLGANLGDPPAAIRAALDALACRGHVRIDAVSSLYRTAPWGPVPQPDYANACALATTDLAPRALLAEVKSIEDELGRRPGERWGPRAIDIDILFYAGETLDTPDLIIPHDSLFQRAFVLVPLAEIAPDLVIAGRRIDEAAASVDGSGVTPWPGLHGAFGSHATRD
jgi:2-amino-4-hydroxy-6-hydroxymethyldihydropteridine diphosphokinase